MQNIDFWTCDHYALKTRFFHEKLVTELFGGRGAAVPEVANAPL
jgi:hypothetical protein